VKSKFLKEYFNFSKRERNGVIVLFIILSAIFITKLLISNSANQIFNEYNEFEDDIDVFVSYQNPDFENVEMFYFDPNTASMEELLSLGLSPKSVNAILAYRDKGWKFYKTDDLLRVKQLSEAEFEAIKDFVKIQRTQYSNNSSGRNYTRKKYEKKEIILKEFDPNHANKDDLISLGFKAWQAENIIKYRNRGGIFKTPEDLEKIYGLDDELIETVKPFVRIDIENIPEVKESFNEKQNISILLNSADEIELQKINGIGPSYSKRIVEYRNKLGGYINIEQLKEVYGITPELYNQIKDYFIIETQSINKININTADFKTLITHPYINQENTKTILNYREFSGTINSFDDLLKQKAITQEFYDKVSPYICTE
jgi:competence ComEA-like helix-hairpin-helix protein